MTHSRIIIASGNAGKIREIRQALADLPAALIPQNDLGIAPADEPHESFIENAIAKARAASRAGGLPALADDSGLCVAALGGAPGVRSARFAGENADDDSNNRLLIESLKGISDRRACYFAAMVFLRFADDPMPLIAQGLWRGVIIDTPRGSGGFGYDPYFIDESLGKTGAEMSAAEKNKVSHRGQSLRELAKKLRASGFFNE